MLSKFRWLGLVPLLSWLVLPGFAGGSGLNVVVVVNQASSNSVALGNYYCERRGVPPQNVLRITWSGGNIAWSLDDFNAYLRNPLQTMLASRGLTNQVDFVVLSMDIPFQVSKSGTSYTGGVNSTTAALYYGFKVDNAPPGPYPSCSLPLASSNAYAGSEALFRSRYPATPGNVPFLTMMITATNLPLAKAIIDQGVAGDYTAPVQPVVLAKSSDVFRNIRYLTFDDTIFNARLLQSPNISFMVRDWPQGLNDLLGYENGTQLFAIDTGTFVPGAMADSLTSYGGLILGFNDHTSLLEFLRAGATASYGTVVEPCAYLEKFPSPQVYFYQARGFNIAESYYQGLTNPYQGLLVGEPLSSPFGQPAVGAWLAPAPGSQLAGTTNLAVRFTATTPDRPIQQVDLFVDGTWARTLTNIAPAAGNVLNVTVNGRSLDYTVPSGATLQSIASDLADRLNAPSFSNFSKVAAVAHGDRIELQSMDMTRSAAETTLSTGNSTGSAQALTASIHRSGGAFLETQAFGRRTFKVKNDPAVGGYLRLAITRTNGSTTVIGVTNQVAGTKIVALAQSLVNQVNSHPAFESADGLTAVDLADYTPFGEPLEFALRPNSTGWPAAGIRATLSGSGELSIEPSGERMLDENVPFLRPRAHLYVTAGATNLPLTFALNTTSLPNGSHEFAAVAYEGSHVRTQSRAGGSFRVQNGTLSATFSQLPAVTNTLISLPLQFSVQANSSGISRIELFSTGGALTNILNTASAAFSITGADLGAGLHPFYALVTANTGQQYRTETLWVRFMTAADETPFLTAIETWPPTLTWPAVAGQSYTVLSTTNLTVPFQQRALVLATNSIASWIDTAADGLQRFYRIRAAN